MEGGLILEGQTKEQVHTGHGSEFWAAGQGILGCHVPGGWFRMGITGIRLDH